MSRTSGAKPGHARPTAGQRVTHPFYGRGEWVRGAQLNERQRAQVSTLDKSALGAESALFFVDAESRVKLVDRPTGRR